MKRVRDCFRSDHRFRIAAATAGASVLALIGEAAFAGPVIPDPTFSGDGKRRIAHTGRDVLVQPDGRILVVGGARGAGDFAVTRLTPDGRLDPSFAGGGRRLIDFGAFENAFALALQGDDKIVVVGRKNIAPGIRLGAVARINPDGSLDSSFDGDGKRTIERGYGIDLADVVIQSNGKVVIAGSGYSGLLVGRLNPDGSLDARFGDGGKRLVTFEQEHWAYAVALQGDGKIIVAGAAHPGGLGQGTNAVAARLNRDGSLDSSFDGDGRLTLDIGHGYDFSAQDVFVQPDGRIVFVGDRHPAPGFTVWRRYRDGSSDSSFGGSGVVTLRFGDEAHGTAGILQSDGRMVVAGAGLNSDREFDFSVARLTADGLPDPRFDGDGKRMIDFGGKYDGAEAIALQRGGRIVLAGLTNAGHAFFRGALVRLTTRRGAVRRARQ